MLIKSWFNNERQCFFTSKLKLHICNDETSIFYYTNAVISVSWTLSLISLNSVKGNFLSLVLNSKYVGRILKTKLGSTTIVPIYE